MSETMAKSGKMSINKQNAQLGALGCLPQEIRDRIYGLVFDAHFEHAIQTVIHDIEDPWESDEGYLLEGEFLRRRFILFQPSLKQAGVYCDPDEIADGDILALQWYMPLYSYQDGFELRIRRASLALRDEFDAYFLWNYTIKFDCPNALAMFFAELPSAKQYLIRRITVQICNRCHWCVETIGRSTTAHEYWPTIDEETERWIQVFEGISATAMDALTAVSFEVGKNGLGGQYPGQSGYGWNWTGRGDYTPVVKMKKVVQSMSVLAGELRRRSPDVWVGLAEEECYYEEDLVHVRAAFRQLR